MKLTGISSFPTSYKIDGTNYLDSGKTLSYDSQGRLLSCSTVDSGVGSIDSVNFRYNNSGMLIQSYGEKTYDNGSTSKDGEYGEITYVYDSSNGLSKSFHYYDSGMSETNYTYKNNRLDCVCQLESA